MPDNGFTGVNNTKLNAFIVSRVEKAEKARRRAKNRAARQSRRINRKQTNHRNWK